MVDCLPYQGERLGFALPLFADPKQPSVRFAQEVDEVNNCILAFLALEGEVPPVALTDSTRSASIGDEKIFAFFTEDGVSHLGTILELTPILRGYASRFPNQNSSVLQILELIGTAKQKRDARLSMRKVLSESAGVRSTRAFYEGSVLRTALWNNLVDAATNEELARRILKVRAQLRAHVGDDGNLSLDLSALAPEDRSALDEKKLLLSILAEFSVSELQNSNIDTEVEMLQEMHTESVSELLYRARNAGRQEERIAILIDGILQNTEVGTAALLQYNNDRASYANWALGQIREKLLQNDYKNWSQEKAAAKLVGLLFSQHYTLSRGELLIYLAKHLGKWPAVNEAIRQTLHRTRSIMIEPYRSSIEELLKHPELHPVKNPIGGLFEVGR